MDGGWSGEWCSVLGACSAWLGAAAVHLQRALRATACLRPHCPACHSPSPQPLALSGCFPSSPPSACQATPFLTVARWTATPSRRPTCLKTSTRGRRQESGSSSRGAGMGWLGRGRCGGQRGGWREGRNPQAEVREWAGWAEGREQRGQRLEERQGCWPASATHAACGHGIWLWSPASATCLLITCPLFPSPTLPLLVHCSGVAGIPLPGLYSCTHIPSGITGLSALNPTLAALVTTNPGAWA